MSPPPRIITVFFDDDGVFSEHELDISKLIFRAGSDSKLRALNLYTILFDSITIYCYTVVADARFLFRTVLLLIKPNYHITFIGLYFTKKMLLCCSSSSFDAISQN